MKFQMTKDWCVRMSELEGNVEIGAGALGQDPKAEGLPTAGSVVAAETEQSLVFSTFVQLMRRKKKLTIEELASRAAVEIGELVIIEKESHYRPEPRTVFQLAQVFSVSAKKLMELSGNAEVKDERFREEAVRFAARSRSIEKLTSEERMALEQFVKFLSDA